MTPDVDPLAVKDRPLTSARSPAPPRTSRGAPRPALLVMLAIVVCIGVAAAWLGWRAGAAVQPEAPPPPTLEAAAVGPVRFEIPAGWTRTTLARAGLPDLEAGRSVAYAVAPGVPASAVVTVGEVDHPTLIPAGLRAALARPAGRPAAAVLGGRRAWLYSGLKVRRGAEVLDVNATVVPSTVGTIALACVSSPGWSGACRPFDVRRLGIAEGTVLAPADDLAFRSTLPPVLERLERARARGRAELNARTRRGQARAARRLGAAYASARSHLEAVTPPRGPARDVVNALVAGAAAYRAAGRAADDGDANRYTAAGGRVRSAEDALAAALGALSAPPRA